MILKFMELSCDECIDSVVGPFALRDGIRSMRKVARNQGWVFRDGRDLCPVCIVLVLADASPLIPD